ncbi:HIT family protein, partial [Candidatus Woesearchaeota archaeon]|nr:HIT family protein [Candidatus Woesearchaeota archaeon]
EDDDCFAVLSNKMALGHIEVYPKKHFSSLKDVPDELVKHLFFTASFAASAAFELLGAHGTNIIVNEGKLTEGDNHLCFNIIPRKSDDGLSFKWEPKSLSEEENTNVLERLKDKTSFVGEPEEEKEGGPIDLDKEKEPKTEIKGDNLLIKQLRRIP